MRYTILASLFASTQLFAGQLTLTGQTAQIQGPKGSGQLDYNQGLLRFWHSADSIPTWKFNAKQSGTIEILVTYANHQVAGTECNFSFGNASRFFTVKDTGSWKNFKTVNIGKFHFSKGLNTLSVNPKELKTRAVMDLKSIQLKGDTHLLKPHIPIREERPGYRRRVAGAHPSIQIADITPNHLNFKVNGIDFLSDGTMVVAAWDQRGSVYLIKNYQGSRSEMKISRFADGIAEPLGVKVINDQIYVLQKQELTRLVDSDGDGKCDRYECVSNAWDVSSNFHEFCFGPLNKDGYFYVALAVAVDKGGATTNPQVKDRGTLIKIDEKTGKYEVVSAGLRTPNGIGFTADNKHILISDNQGDYLPGNKIVCAKPGRFYNHRYNPPHPYTKKQVTPPVVWLPHNEIANSPTEPIAIREGVYKNHYLVGDIHHGGIRRIFTETVNGELQGTAFRFSSGFRGGTNRISYGPDGNLYVGISGHRGNWGTGKRDGLQRVSFTNKSVFEILAVRTKTNGLEIEFTEPLAENVGWDPQSYELDSFTYKPTSKYGGPKIDRHTIKVKSASVSADRKRVFLETSTIKPSYVVHGLVKKSIVNEKGNKAWNAEWWTTVNQQPKDQIAKVSSPPKNAIIELGKITQNKAPFAAAKLAYRENCMSCHTTTSKKLVGPGLAKLFGKKQTVIRNGKKVQVTIDRDYLKKAIIDPGAEFPVGYQPIMPNLSGSLTKKQLNDILNWMESMK